MTSWITRNRRRSLLLAIAAAAVAAGLIVAIASASSNPHHANTPRARLTRSRAKHRSAAHRHGLRERAVAARYLGLTRAQLRARLRSHRRPRLRSGQTLAQIAGATTGKSPTGLIEALVSASQQARMASVRSRITLAVEGVRASTGRSAAAYLGVSVTKIRHELRSGKSLAQIAGATPGKSVTGLITALVSAKEAEVKTALGSGTLGHAAADRYLSNVRQRVTRQVEHAPHASTH